MPITLSNAQERVERSIYEAIRRVLVDSGYLPDITDPSYPNDPTGQAQFQTDLEGIKAAKGFAAEVYGHSSSLSKGNKRVPRIAIIPRRLMPGDIGRSITGGYSPDPLDPDSTVLLSPTLQSSNLHIDINIISGSAAQDRFLHAVLGRAIQTWSYIPMWDNPRELFFIRQFNFYDLPDDPNGIEEKVYSYEVPDLYLYEGDVKENVTTINQIKVYIWNLEQEAVVPSQPIVIPSPAPDMSEGIYIDLSGVYYTLP